MARTRRQHRKHRKNPREHRRVRRHVYSRDPRRQHRRHHRRHAYAMNRRHHRRHRYSHNPPAASSIVMELGVSAVGYIGTKLVGNYATPFLPAGMGQQPIVRIMVKGGLAYLVAWGGEKLLGRRYFMPLFLGGALEAVQDLVKTFLAPSFPALGDYNEGVHAGEIGTYYNSAALGMYANPEVQMSGVNDGGFGMDDETF